MILVGIAVWIAFLFFLLVEVIAYLKRNESMSDNDYIKGIYQLIIFFCVGALLGCIVGLGVLAFVAYDYIYNGGSLCQNC